MLMPLKEDRVQAACLTATGSATLAEFAVDGLQSRTPHPCPNPTPPPPRLAPPSPLPHTGQRKAWINQELVVIMPSIA